MELSTEESNGVVIGYYGFVVGLAAATGTSGRI